MNPDPIIIGTSGIEAPDENEPGKTKAASEPEMPAVSVGDVHIHEDLMRDPQALEEAIMDALRRMERRQSRALKKLRDKADKKHRRQVRDSRRRNRP